MTAAEKKELQELQQRVEFLEKSEAELKHQLNKSQEERLALEAELTATKEAKATVEQEAIAIIKDLQGKAEKQPAATGAHTATLSIAGEQTRKFRFKVPKFRHEGVIYKATDVEDNSSLLKELVAIEAGVIEEV